MLEFAKLAEPLDIGGVTIRNRVFLAPMSGVTDEAFRSAPMRMAPGWSSPKWWRAANLPRAGWIRDRRIRHSGLPVHMVQLAGREAHHMAEAARDRGGRGRRHHRHQYGLPGQEGDGRLFRLGADARSRPCADADRRGGRRGRCAGYRQDAARLGRKRAQRADAGAPRRAGRRQDGDGPWPHALPVLSGQGRLARNRPRQGGGFDSGRGEWRCLFGSGCRGNPVASPAPMR